MYQSLLRSHALLLALLATAFHTGSVAAGDPPAFCAATGHYYEFNEGNPLTWQEAEVLASNFIFMTLPGHLATITSQAEQDCVEALFRPDDAWLGGFQPPGTPEPNDGWEWVTGETWNYTNWNEGEPNDDNVQDCLQFYDAPNDGQWDDLECDGEGEIDAFIVEFEPEGGGGGGDGSRATFRTVKFYNDFNPAPVDVTISCNTGLPLEQTFELDPAAVPDLDPFVEFVVTDFESGTLDCEITESVPAGYTVFYLTFIDGQGFETVGSCPFEDVEHGETFSTDPVHNLCLVVNALDPSEVTVTKEWIDENPQFNATNFAKANYFCSNLPNFLDNQADAPTLGGVPLPISGNEGFLFDPQSGSLEFLGNPGVDSFFTFANWDGGTDCEVTEQLVEGGVETDASDCDSIVLFPGDSGACTIVNTRLFEGIPTLSQYGLAVLTLLMLGFGLVAYRRLV